MTQTSAVLTGKRCECPTCSEIFSTVGNFDRHRVGEHGLNRKCVNPHTVGLEIKTNAKGTFWGMPGRTVNDIPA